MAMYDGQFLHDGLAEMAGAYLFHLAMNHAFVDGNKRIAAVASLTFLAINGVRLDLDQIQFENLILAVARGECSKKQVCEYFRTHLHSTRE
jgi:death-on-curing protein